MPPRVRFQTKIALRYVDAQGFVKQELPALANWNPSMGIESVLVGIKNSMNGNREKQPSEGESYF